MRKLQTFLVDRNYDPGPVDGIWGWRTCAGLMGYMVRRQPVGLIAELAKGFVTHFPTGQITPDRPLRILHFLAQSAQETGSFRSLVEDMNWKSPARLDATFSAVKGIVDARNLIERGPKAIANRVYANRLGNGDEDGGDGWAYRGRGALQTTGRDNYAGAQAASGLPLLKHPDMLREPVYAAQSAVAFWIDRRINVPADADDIREVTFRVNGPARLHMNERAAFLKRGKTAWGL